MDGTVEVRGISASATRVLRQRVLRPHQRVEDIVFGGDDDPRAGHFGAFHEEVIIGVASICPEDRSGATHDVTVWRVRGMAVDPGWRSSGIGAKLLDACIEHARLGGGRLVWCNARIGARRFYERHGFVVDGEPFELPDIGVHYVMVRRTESADTT